METLSNQTKQLLGTIIRETRQLKYNTTKATYGKNDNPYNRINFCGRNQICHGNTLLKIETSFVREDDLYEIFLNKLDLSYRVSEEKHLENMKIISECKDDVFHSIEYIDDELIQIIYKKISALDFSDDCIAKIHLLLIDFEYKLQTIQQIDDVYLNTIMAYQDVYQGIFLGLYKHCLGIYYIRKYRAQEAEQVILEAKMIYDLNSISKGVYISHLLNSYLLQNKYQELVTECLEMEKYFKKTNNEMRLVHIYSYLADYYYLLSKEELGEEYYLKSIEITQRVASMKRFSIYIRYNFGYHLFKIDHYEAALYQFSKAVEECVSCDRKIKIILMVLFVMVKLKKSDEEMIQYLSLIESMLHLASKDDLMLYRYFKYRLKKTSFYRRYTNEKLLPYMRNNPIYMPFLLLIYQDINEM